MKKQLAGIPKLKSAPRLHIFSFILFALAYVATGPAARQAACAVR